MHFLAYVLIDSEGDAVEQVSKLMAPHEKREEMDFSTRGWWDWWVIGGRWMGLFDDSFDVSGLSLDDDWIAVDVVTAEEAAKDGRVPHTLVSEDAVMHRKEWNGSDFVPMDRADERMRDAIAAHKGRVVVVDYHS